jgi:transcription elongation factor GreA
MNRSSLYQGSRTQLINQLIYWDDEKSNFLNQYFPEFNQKRQMVDKVLSVYASTIETIIPNLTEEAINSIALIGSKLTVRYLDDQTSDYIIIVFPHRADPSKNMVSFLSPMGFQLLMAKVNETYQLSVPSGEISVRVEAIQYVNSGEI